MTDSIISEGWSNKINFSELNEDAVGALTEIKVARKHAMNLLDIGVKDYSQWFPGSENQVVDALSQDDDRSEKELIHFLNVLS